MKQPEQFCDFYEFIRRAGIKTAVALALVAVCPNVYGANVVARGSGTTTSRPTVRANHAESRMPTLNTRAQSASGTAPAEEQVQPAPEPTADTAPDTEPEPDPVIIENKTSQFDKTLSATVTSSNNDANANNLADMVQRQRAALDAQSAGDAAASATAAAMSSGQSACDTGLRECMKQKCGDDYSKCAGDGDTIWGDKMDACRRDVKCTGHQYQMFAAEIKADRDMNARLSAYTKIIDCGNSYNDCIVTQCGPTYSKCLGKTAGDAAIAACATLAKNCTQQDSGLASRTMNVFATLRQDAEKQIVKDEQRLYELRDKMRSQCQRLGAMFDERSLVCVYTVNFFAGNSTTPTASKKAYAGSAFDCSPDWFGIDVTTFKENAYRYTRSQTSASSALLGAGLGIGVGALTSGAIDRAVDRQKAENALKKAEKEYDADYGQGGGGTTLGANGSNNGSSSLGSDSMATESEFVAAASSDFDELEAFVNNNKGQVKGTRPTDIPPVSKQSINEIIANCQNATKIQLNYPQDAKAESMALQVTCDDTQYNIEIKNRNAIN